MASGNRLFRCTAIEATEHGWTVTLVQSYSQGWRATVPTQDPFEFQVGRDYLMSLESQPSILYEAEEKQ